MSSPNRDIPVVFIATVFFIYTVIFGGFVVFIVKPLIQTRNETPNTTFAESASSIQPGFLIPSSLVIGSLEVTDTTFRKLTPDEGHRLLTLLCAVGSVGWLPPNTIDSAIRNQFSDAIREGRLLYEAEAP